MDLMTFLSISSLMARRAAFAKQPLMTGRKLSQSHHRRRLRKPFSRPQLSSLSALEGLNRGVQFEHFCLCQDSRLIFTKLDTSEVDLQQITFLRSTDRESQQVMSSFALGLDTSESDWGLKRISFRDGR